MKKLALALTALAVTQINSAFADENIPLMGEEAVTENEISTPVIPEPEPRMHGTLKTLIEYEGWRYDDKGRSLGMKDGGKFKPAIEGNFRHDSLVGWDFGFHASREDIFEGRPGNQDYQMNNAITEVYANRNYDKDWGNIGYGFKLASESADDRTMPEVKVFGGYQLTEKLRLQGYGLYHIEYKRGHGEFRYWEVEPGFSYQIADNMGMWLNFRYQVGDWHPDASSNVEREVETIIKPGMWVSFGKFAASTFAEIGKFQKDDRATGSHLWTEDYVKIGVGSNYQIAKDWTVFGEFSYKNVEFKNTDKEEFSGYLPVVIAGISYSF